MCKYCLKEFHKKLGEVIEFGKRIGVDTETQSMEEAYRKLEKLILKGDKSSDEK